MSRHLVNWCRDVRPPLDQRFSWECQNCGDQSHWYSSDAAMKLDRDRHGRSAFWRWRLRRSGVVRNRVAR